MNSTILNTGIRLLFPLFIGFSFFMLFRGHDEPGGGFIAGLLGASAFVFYGIAHDMEKAARLLRFDPMYMIAVGFLLAFLSGIFAFFFDEPFMKAFWPDFSLPFIGTPGTPIIFDIGVYLAVVGTVLKICFSMTENEM